MDGPADGPQALPQESEGPACAGVRVRDGPRGRSRTRGGSGRIPVKTYADAYVAPWRKPDWPSFEGTPARVTYDAVRGGFLHGERRKGQVAAVRPLTSVLRRRPRSPPTPAR